MPFPKTLFSFRIWTQVSDFIFYNDNRYSKSDSMYLLHLLQISAGKKLYAFNPFHICSRHGNFAVTPVPVSCSQAINRLSIIWKSNLTDKMKRSFFQAAVTLILLYGCTTWTLTKRLDKKLKANYTRIPWAILNKSWRQHPTRHQRYGHLPPITKTIQVPVV